MIASSYLFWGQPTRPRVFSPEHWKRTAPGWRAFAAAEISGKRAGTIDDKVEITRRARAGSPNHAAEKL
jgi:hypothetical protein